MYYNSDSVLFLDGKFVKAEDAKIDLFGQTLHYGYGVFEGIRAYQTINGTKIFKSHEHYERLKKSCELLSLPLHYSEEELTQLSYQLLDKNNLSNAYLRPLVFSGPNMSLIAPKEVTLMIAAWDWGKYFSHTSLRVCISSYQRPNPKSIRMEAKACGHYVNSIMATTEAKERGFDEALMTDINGFVAEGPGANFFFEKDGTLFTPPLGNILPGITRQTVLEICRELDIPVQQRLFRPEELFDADGAFFCGTAAEITAIESIEGQALNKPWKKTFGSVIQEAYQSIVLDKSYSYVIV
ncbi:MAG TPA: branched-chain amino acid transaminase [Cyclobacteriaceae bacterium]|nr:branched-chain amino acid transaminase [Cyclobacteriaceae bacterium]